MPDTDNDILNVLTSHEQKPSKDELLSIVCKHSGSLEQTASDLKDAGEDELDTRYWREIFDMFFFGCARESKSREDDDMIFFVRNTNWQNEYELVNRPGEEPYFVRRWNSSLEKVIGESAAEIDWRRSFYLNLIAHTSFTITVAICSIDSLEKHQKDPGSPLKSVYKVTKTVYASPSRVNFQLDAKKAIETVPAYPDICFAVDDFDDTFSAMILTEGQHCYCVVLNASGGAAFPSNQIQESNKSSGQITLFSAFVSYTMVRDAYDAGKWKFSNFLSPGNPSPRSEKLLMRGPGGCGEVEVAVSSVADHSGDEAGPSTTSQTAKEGFRTGIGTIVRKAAIAASIAAKHAYEHTSSKKPEPEMLPLRCCLMSLSLPWNTIAYDLLFKGLSTPTL